MSFGNLVGLLMGDPSSSLVSASSQLGSPAEKGTVRNLVSRLAGLLPTEIGAPLDISANVPGAAPPVSPMGNATSQSMAGYTPGDVGDPQATNLDPVQKSLLNAISTGESNGRYDVRYTPKGGMRFTDFTKHPGIFEPGPEGPSSAAGRYQFTKSTWDSLGGGPFDPTTQDIRGWQLAEKDYRTRTGRDLSDDLKAKGFTPDIARSLSDTWTSFRNPSVVKQAQMVFERSRKKYEGTTPVAGDVVPFPAPSADQTRGTTGPTNQSADYGWGNRTDPNVTSIGKGTMTDWLRRAGERYRGGGMTIPIPPPRPGVGPDAAPGPGGGPAPLTDATPEQHESFRKLVADTSPEVQQALDLVRGPTAQNWQRVQNANALPEELKKFFTPQELRKIGIDRLKQFMLYAQGIDTPLMDSLYPKSGPGGYFNDQPTNIQRQRDSAAGKDTAERLKDAEAMMELRSNKRRPFGKWPLTPRNFMKT